MEQFKLHNRNLANLLTPESGQVRIVEGGDCVLQDFVSVDVTHRNLMWQQQFLSEKRRVDVELTDSDCLVICNQ